MVVCPASILAWCRCRKCAKTNKQSQKMHTLANTRPAAPSLEDTITPPSRLFIPTSQSFPFPSFPYSLWDVHICSYVGLSKGSPPCPKASTSNPRFLKKLARMQAFLAAYDKGLGWYWLLGPILFKEWPFVLDVFWHAWVSIFGFSPCPESSSCTSLLSIRPLCSDRGGALVF